MPSLTYPSLNPDTRRDITYSSARNGVAMLNRASKPESAVRNFPLNSAEESRSAFVMLRATISGLDTRVNECPDLSCPSVSFNYIVVNFFLYSKTDQIQLFCQSSSVVCNLS